MQLVINWIFAIAMFLMVIVSLVWLIVVAKHDIIEPGTEYKDYDKIASWALGALLPVALYVLAWIMPLLKR